MGFGVLTGISIGLLNESLGFNSVGFYQGKLSALVGSSFLILQRTRQKFYFAEAAWKTTSKNVNYEDGERLHIVVTKSWVIKAIYMMHL
ncbi:uncharacterized protein [Triticum aestivum]|uniref:uncharacterized protein isoform X2 n=2 Tax=Triticum aestivum TaxID=4565 RepID=UPI000E79EC6A|nr:uncharacterized protein LOC123087822 isoform X2 [Triticum aestivum]